MTGVIVAALLLAVCVLSPATEAARVPRQQLRPQRRAVVRAMEVATRATTGMKCPSEFTVFGEEVQFDLEEHSELTTRKSMFCIGTVRGNTKSEVEILVNGDGTSGSINMAGKVIEILAKDNGRTEMTEIDLSKVRPDVDAETPSVPFDNEPELSVRSSDIEEGPMSRAKDEDMIDLVVFYTKNAEQENGGVAGTLNKIELMEGDMNTGYLNSGLSTRVRVVHSELVDYDEDAVGDWSQHLNLFTRKDDGKMDNVHSVREKYGGDACVLLISPTSDGATAGIAWIQASYATAFSVNENKFASSIVVAHEVGHNLGCAHDRNTGGGAADEWARGFQNLDKGAVTIMAYQCSGCEYLTVHSRPEPFQGMKIGDANNDCARKVRERTAVVSSFSPSVVKKEPNPNGDPTPKPSKPPKGNGDPTPQPTDKPNPTNECKDLGPSNFTSSRVRVRLVNNLQSRVDVSYMDGSGEARLLGRLSSGMGYNINAPIGTVMRLSGSDSKQCIMTFKVEGPKTVTLD